MYDMVDEAMRLLQSRHDLASFGRLLHESWQLKRRLSDKISTPVVDQLYEQARLAGAIGGKLLGAGGGGFLLLFVKPEHRPRVVQASDGFLHVPFQFEHLGSQIIFYDPDSATPDRSTLGTTRRPRKVRQKTTWQTPHSREPFTTPSVR